MPSKSRAQNRLMEAVAHDPDFAKKVDIPKSVGEDYAEADKGRDIKELPKHVKEDDGGEVGGAGVLPALIVHGLMTLKRKWDEKKKEQDNDDDSDGSEYKRGGPIHPATHNTDDF